MGCVMKLRTDAKSKLICLTHITLDQSLACTYDHAYAGFYLIINIRLKLPIAQAAP